MCVNPITIKVEQSNPNAPPFRMVQVPCGKCPICVQKYQNSWTIRIIEEFKNWSKSTFLTLTYSPEKVPYLCQPSTGELHNTVCKKHIQDWFKRFRIRYKRMYGKDALFKYFLCSEYGPTTLRPHYHAIIFGLSKTELHLAISDWRKMFGFVVADNIDLTSVKSRLNSARYVGNYCNKGHFETPLVSKKKVLPTFRLMSKGLGSSFVDKHKERILNRSLGGYRLEDINDKLIYSINDFNYSLPRYYKDKILPPKSLLRYKVADSALKKSDEVYRSELEALLAEMPENEAVSYMALQEAYANRQRAISIEDRQNKIYKYSKV